MSAASKAGVEVAVRPIEQVEEGWERLADRVGSPPFLRPGWTVAWSRAFAGRAVSALTASEGSEVVGVWPVLERRRAAVSPTNWQTPWFSPVVRDSEVASSLAATLLRRGAARIDVSFLRAENPTRETLFAAARAAGARTLERVVRRSPYVPAESSWEDYEASLPGKRRADLRRRRRRLEERGEVGFESSDGSGRVDELLAEGLRVEAAGWKGARGTAISSRPETRRFYEEVAGWAAAQGSLRLWGLRLGDRLLAFAFCLNDGKAHYVLKIGFDPEFGRYAPGSLLTREMLRAAFEAGLRSYEFLGGPDPYKLDWTSSCHELVRIQLFAPGLAGTASRLAWERGRPLAKRLLARRTGVRE